MGSSTTIDSIKHVHRAEKQARIRAALRLSRVLRVPCEADTLAHELVTNGTTEECERVVLAALDLVGDETLDRLVAIANFGIEANEEYLAAEATDEERAAVAAELARGAA